jgi:hypothetical protein
LGFGASHLGRFCFGTFAILHVAIRVELLPGFKFTSKSVKNIEFTGKIGKTGKR